MALAVAMALGTPAALAGQTPRPDGAELAFRDLYRDMVETDTSAATGDCNALVLKIAERFRNAGFAENQITLFRDEAYQLDGGIVVLMAGNSAKAKPMLLLGHLDVANANPRHWKRDPFKLVERDGSFFGRGTADMKALDAIWVDTLLRFKAEGLKPKRTIKLALTCGQELSARANGTEWLARHRPELLEAEFALGEGGGGLTDGHGKVVTQSIAIGEMTMANFDVETFSAGGPSAIPNYDNAISKMIDALQKVRAYRFPLHLNVTTRRYFAQAGVARGDAMGAAMVRIAADPKDSAAEAIVSSDPTYDPMLRTTCLTTLIQGGYIVTAIPQTAKATINCYIVPGETAEETRDALYSAIGDPKVIMSRVGRAAPPPLPPVHDPRVLRPAEKLVASYYPGVQLVPAISLIATDAAYLAPLGIPAFGVPGLYADPDGNEVHGHNEHLQVQSLMTARGFLHDLVKVYAMQE
ncbi:M20/M25/M40 family metallo-hydrolase [Novosphingobium sediminis]|uniref:M20/M25/M40 family metallo-hydrolase n=1 Tax=Novosphingobium sediminis TaxID=707214 RepID=UPI001FEAB724|nr:M20/M25/M40 family metallo-hydrolase [Novosphingobium sediminis]